MEEPVKIRLIAFDLDYTLLNREKKLPPENAQALREAAEAGVEIVPATGRFFTALPEAVRELPLRYVITSNGAQVLDVAKGEPVIRAEIPPETALDLMRYFDTLPQIFYECTLDDQGWMPRAFYERIADFAPDEPAARMLRDLRKPVEDLKRFVAEQNRGLQKVQAFTWDLELRARLLETLSERFPGLMVATSSANNLEINDVRAGKGKALRALAGLLGIPLSETMAFGDDRNDVEMLQTAGISVAMGNARPEARAAARFVTLSCDEAGVAAGIRRFLACGGRS